jgi:hypothetical protein
MGAIQVKLVWSKSDVIIQSTNEADDAHVPCCGSLKAFGVIPARSYLAGSIGDFIW